jgi:hypothetical protein
MNSEQLYYVSHFTSLQGCYIKIVKETKLQSTDMGISSDMFRVSQKLIISCLVILMFVIELWDEQLHRHTTC